MDANASFEEPTTTKIHQTQYEEDDEVADLERKISSFRREKRSVSTDSSTITTTSSSSSSSSSSDCTDSFSADEPNGKAPGAALSNAAEVEDLEVSKPPEHGKDDEFHGEHNEGKTDSVYFDGEQGLESNGVAGAESNAHEPNADDYSNGEKNQSDSENGSIAKDNEQSVEIEEVEMRDSPEDMRVVRQLNPDVTEEEVDIEAEDYGVEKVLENQETHDLFCPNCNSCITKRVVLKRRKRKIHHVLEDAKREKLNVPDDSVRSGDNEPLTDDPVDGPCLFRCLSCFSIFLPTGEGFKLFRFTKGVKESETPLLTQQTPTDKPNWFLSLFVPNKKETAVVEGGVHGNAPQVNSQDNIVFSPETTTESAIKDPLEEARDDVQGDVTTSKPGGASTSSLLLNEPPPDKNGTPSKLFRLTKDVKENETPLLTQQTPTHKPNWFLSLFVPNKKETAVDEGGVRAKAPQVNPQGKIVSSPEATSDSAIKDPLEEARDDAQGGITTSKLGGASTSSLLLNEPPPDPKGTPSNINEHSETEVLVWHADTIFTQDRKPVAVESDDNSKAVINDEETTTDGLGFLASLADKDSNISNGNKPSGKVRFSPIRQYDNIEVSEKIPVGHVEVNIDPKLPMIGGSSIPKSEFAPSTGTEENLEIISDPGPVETNPPGHDSPLDDLRVGLLEDRNVTQPRLEVGESRKLEILKSIVYGGLIESITSLGVISSAAGSGATTLNILVLGLANLIGGLILIVHNIQELRKENPRSATTDGNEINEREDRYKQLLGRRENFRIHATVAILSFIIVGLIPPVVYGYSFRKSDNRDYKAISVFGGSLVCIILLAIAKAHVKTPRESYLKSVFYYTIMATSVSGVSYVVGEMVSQWLEKYGWSENPAELMLPLLGRKGGIGFGYSSY